MIVLQNVQHLLLQELKVNLRNEENITFGLVYMLEVIQKFLLSRLPGKCT